MLRHPRIFLILRGFFEMVDYKQTHVASEARTSAQIDAGLRSYMLGIYNYMATALFVTAIAAVGIAGVSTTSDPSQAVARLDANTYLTSLGVLVYTSPLRWVLMFAPLAFVMVLSFGIHRFSKSSATGLFYLFSAVMGVSISWIFLVFTGESIVQTFFVTAAAFLGLSLYGYTTKRNLTGLGSFLIMGLFGIIIAMIVNIFLASSALAFAINVIGVLIFAGLTAYDTQRLKLQYDYVRGNAEALSKSSIMGALSLYLNFINMFMFLLQFMGNRD